MTDTTYPDLLGATAELADNLTPNEQLSRLYRLIAPLLDTLPADEFSDEPELSTPEAVHGIRRQRSGSRSTPMRSITT